MCIILQCFESARFSQPIIGLAEPIDDRLHNRFRFMGRHDENFRTWTVRRGNEISHHSIRDIDLSIIGMILCSNIFNAKQGIQLKKKIYTIIIESVVVLSPTNRHPWPGNSLDLSTA